MAKYRFRIFDKNQGQYMFPTIEGRVPVWKSKAGGITLDLALQDDNLFSVEMKIPDTLDYTGKEIYEGDIVEILEDDKDLDNIKNNEMFIVKWVNMDDFYFFGLVDSKGNPIFDLSKQKMLLVVGNVNENKGLFPY